MTLRFSLSILMLIGLWACQSPAGQEQETGQQEAPATDQSTHLTTGSIERLDPSLDALIPADAQLEIVAEGFEWCEGPLWVAQQNMLIFSDIPQNKVFKWTEAGGLETYLHPAGFTGESSGSGEPGSNGLILNDQGQLVLCQHGDRRMARMEAPLDQPASQFVTLVDKYNGMRLNSPNDATFDAEGNLLFTDPPYGLPGQENDPGKEIPFQGVYRLSAETGELSLLTDELTRPNGIALSPDGKTLYVANSDPNRAIWMAYDYEEGEARNSRVFYEVTDKVDSEPGLPDGLKTDAAGNVWATGPGGVWIFSPEAKVLGKLKTGQATSNCAFDADGKTFYMTADMYILRLQL